MNFPVADLGFQKKGHFSFEESGGHQQKHFLRSIRGNINLFFVRFCWKKSKFFFEERDDRSRHPSPKSTTGIFLLKKQVYNC